MNSDLNNILGEKIVSDGSYSSIYRNGLASENTYTYKNSGKNYILWNDVNEIYISGTKNSINGIPIGEDRTITIIDSSKSTITFSLGALFRMGKGNKQLFSDMYSFILKNISARQWVQFVQRLRNGERCSFQEFEVTKDAFYTHKFFGGYNEISNAYVKGYNIYQGYFYLLYQELFKKPKSKHIGDVANIPNVHIVEIFINTISKDYFGFKKLLE